MRSPPLQFPAFWNATLRRPDCNASDPSPACIGYWDSRGVSFLNTSDDESRRREENAIGDRVASLVGQYRRADNVVERTLVVQTADATTFGVGIDFTLTAPTVGWLPRL
jgi:hypothetical protein